MRELNAILTIAFRDVTKLFRDRARFFASLVFPVIFIGVLGTSLQASIGGLVSFNFVAFVFTGVFAQSLFQSSAAGVLFLLDDRENDFSKEMFVAPVSPFSLILGKIFGESLVALTQAVGIVVFGILIGVPFTITQFLLLIPIGLIICVFGGSFGLLVLSNISSERTVRQIFPFLIFPQLFLAGVFTPLKDAPLFLEILSKITPMTYAVDFVRGIYYFGQPEYSNVVLFHPAISFTFVASLFGIFLMLGTYLFVRKEKNK